MENVKGDIIFDCHKLMEEHLGSAAVAEIFAYKLFGLVEKYPNTGKAIAEAYRMSYQGPNYVVENEHEIYVEGWKYDDIWMYLIDKKTGEILRRSMNVW